MPSSTAALDIFARYSDSRTTTPRHAHFRMTRETPDCAPVVTPQPSLNTRVLPPELLISVFDAIYLDAVASISFPPQSPPVDRHPLVEVMCVCQMWRRLVEETQRFWTSVVIGTRNERRQSGTRTSPRGKADIVRLERMLARSGTLPLTITIAPERLVDFPLVVESLDRAVYRLDTLNIIPMHDIPRGWCSHVENLFERSFPYPQTP